MSSSSTSAGTSTAACRWTCLSAHLPLAAAAAAGRLLGRSSSASGIVGDRLIVFSGEEKPRVPIDDEVHVFDLQSKEWSRISRADAASWPRARIGHAGAVVGADFYISGGRTGLQAGDETLADLWKFDTVKGQWTEVQTTGATLPALSYHVLAAYGNKIYAFGGCTVDPPHGRTNGLWVLDTTTNVWTELSPQVFSGETPGPCGRGGPALAAYEKEVFVAFGYNGKEEQKDLWRFDLGSKKWSQIEAGGDKPSNRSVTDVVALPGRLFVFGGEFTPSAQGHDGAGEYHADSFVYDISNNTWSQSRPVDLTTAPVARGWFNSLRYKDEVVVFGGFDGVERRNDVYLWQSQ